MTDVSAPGETAQTGAPPADLMAVPPPADPMAAFAGWLAQAQQSEINDPNAMALATSTPDGNPSLRMVLMKGYDPRGVVFYTNLQSRKGEELAANPRASVLFHWKSLRRQVRMEGAIERVTSEEADAYYRTRPRGSRIGAWASEQSRPLPARAILEARVAETDARFPGEEIPRPEFWSGFRLHPHRFEFWQDRRSRLHDRLIYRLHGVDAPTDLGEKSVAKEMVDRASLSLIPV